MKPEQNYIADWISVPGTDLKIPRFCLCGAAHGEKITLTAGVHSQEYVGIQALLELSRSLKPEMLTGTVQILPILNYQGLICRSPDLFPQDGKNLNQVFPGSENGSSTEQLADFLCRKILPGTDWLVDLHSGGFCEELTPHGYLNPLAWDGRLAQYAHIPYVYCSSNTRSLIGGAGAMGIPAMILERGGRGLWTQEEVEAAKKDVLNILRGLGFLADSPAEAYTPRLGREGVFLDAPLSGLWYPNYRAGEKVKKGEVLGKICTFPGEKEEKILAPYDCVILYQTISLGIQEGTPLIACQKL